MPAFKELFEAYGGDYAATMQRFMGNEALYRKLLNMMFQDESLQMLGDALAAGDLQAAFAAAHTLKGVVGNMGLTPLYEAVCAIVEPLRAGEQREDYPALFAAVSEQMRAAAALRDALAAQPS